MSSVQTYSVPSNGSTLFRTHVDWPELLKRVKQNETGAGDVLYALISEGWLFFLQRRMPVHVAEDRMHDAFVIILEAIQDGRIKDGRAFPGYFMTVIRRQYFLHLRSRTNEAKWYAKFFVESLPSASKDNPDSVLDAQWRSSVIVEVLRSMSPKRSEILNRFYVLEQSEEQICTEMKLTNTQHRLLKSRAKAEFGERGREKLNPPKKRSTKSFPFHDILSAQGQINEFGGVDHGQASGQTRLPYGFKL